MKNTRLGILVFAALLTLPVALTGCGGGGGGSTSSTTSTPTPTPAPAASRFVGTWSGPWEETNGQNGTMTFTVAADGTFSGTVTNATYNVEGPFSGTIQSDGSYVYYYSYGAGVSTAPNGTGNLSIDSQGRLTGTLNDVGSGTLTLTRQ